MKPFWQGPLWNSGRRSQADRPCPTASERLQCDTAPGSPPQETAPRWQGGKHLQMPHRQPGWSGGQACAGSGSLPRCLAVATHPGTGEHGPPHTLPPRSPRRSRHGRRIRPKSGCLRSCRTHRRNGCWRSCQNRRRSGCSHRWRGRSHCGSCHHCSHRLRCSGGSGARAQRQERYSRDPWSRESPLPASARVRPMCQGSRGFHGHSTSFAWRWTILGLHLSSPKHRHGTSAITANSTITT